MAKRVGKDCKVALGSNIVSEMGTLTLDGIVTDQMDASAFGDGWKEFMYGMKDGGSVNFNGWFDPDDTQGQEQLVLANLYNSALTNLRVYIDNTSYYEPCQTTYYFSPTVTTGAPTKLSSVTITSLNINGDKAGIMTASFTGKVSGVMVLV